MEDVQPFGSACSQSACFRARELFISLSKRPAACLSCSQVQRGVGSKSGLQTATVFQLCLHVALRVHYLEGGWQVNPPQTVYYEKVTQLKWVIIVSPTKQGETTSGLDVLYKNPQNRELNVTLLTKSTTWANASIQILITLFPFQRFLFANSPNVHGTQNKNTLSLHAFSCCTF